MVFLIILSVMAFQKFFGIAYVNGESMEPVFKEGEVLLLRKWGTPGKGDIVTAYIEESDRVVVKRILAAEGDRIAITCGGIYVNNEKVLEGNLNGQEEQEFLLPPDWYFLIGENQEVSRDSRTFGLVGKSDMEGIVICGLF